ncbi:hypothetical protein ABIA31_002057 [Catenulispora sp. MAP5-51]|uniref:hypothetical protein n=1 Tax=Catenulispora sp. MAP5-51 TaxID=3156298 RepID=UPI0035172018
MAAGCSAAGPKPVVKTLAPSGTSPTSGASAPTDQVSIDALSAYAGMLADMAVAARTADWKDSVLTHHATDQALSELVRILYREQAQGLVSRGAPVSHARVVQVSSGTAPTAAMIEDCADTTSWPEVDPKTGRPPAGANPGGKRLIRARVAEADLVWRVTDLAVNPIGSCS